MFGKKTNNMKRLIFIILLSAGTCFSQKLPDLSDSIVIYKYPNSSHYQLVKSNDSLETFYYPDSTKKATGKYVKAKRNGNWSTFYENGTMQTFGYITDSSFYGKWQFYYENGIRKAKGKFKYAPDDIDSSLLVLKMSGQWKFWDKSGNLLVKTSYSPYRIQAESLYGKYKERYDSGKLKLTGEYHKGSKIGTWKYFYENGQIRSIKYYQYKADSNSKDYPVGIWSFFSKEGNLTKKEIYKNGQLVDTIISN